MVDGKENYKFDLGVKGLIRFVSLSRYVTLVAEEGILRIFATSVLISDVCARTNRKCPTATPQ